MTRPTVSTDPELTDALRRALTTTSAEEYIDTPSALRTRLVAETGARATELRGQIHLLVAGADERLPHALAAAAPVDRLQLDRIAAALATTRGWSVEAAQGVVLVWAAAMDVLAAEPTDALPAPEHVTAGHPPSMGRLEGSVGGPTRLPVAGLLVSSAPGDGRAAVAASTPPTDVAVTDASGPAALRGTLPSVPWPDSKSRDLMRATEREGQAPDGVYRAFHPRSPVILLSVSAVLLALCVLVFVVTKVLVGALPLILIVLVARKMVPEGRLVVDEKGGRFYRKLTDVEPPHVTFVWAEAQVRPGLAARIDTPAGKVWCALYSKAVPSAAGSRANATDGDRHAT